MHGDLARLALALDHQQLVPRIRRTRQTQDHNRNGGPGGVDRFAGLVEQRPHPPELLADEQGIAEFERAAQHQHRRDRTATLFETRLDHVAGGEPARGRGQFEHLGLQQNAVEQRIDALTGACRHFDKLVLTAPFLRNDAVFREFLFHLLRIRLRFVHLVEGDDDGRLCRLRMLDRLDGLWHDTVVGADHQDHDVRDLRAAGAHGAERRMAGCVEERHHPLRRLDVIRADVLGDAARLAGGHLRPTDVIEQRCLAVIDVTHHGHHGWPWHDLERRIGLALQVVLDDVFLAQYRRMPHLLDHENGRVLLDHLVDGRHHAHVHERLDDLGGLHGHFLREFADGDRLGNRDLANDACRRHFETMFGVAVVAHRTPPSVARFLFLVARTDVTHDVQFLAAITRRLVVHHLAHHLARLGGGGLAVALRDLARLHFSHAPGVLLGGPLAVFLVAAAAALLLETLAVEALLLETFGLHPLEGGLRLLLGLAHLVDFLLLQTRLILENLALDIGALAAHLDIHGPCAALGTCQLEFGLGLASQRDLARRGVGLHVIAPVAAAQMRQQLMLGVLADHVFRTVHPDAGLIELLQQPIDRNFQHLGELRDGYICHTCS